VRLRGADLPDRGRLEIYKDGQWGTVCDDGWETNGEENAMVVCRMLNFT